MPALTSPKNSVSDCAVVQGSDNNLAPVVSKIAANQLRINYLDGMRGLAALYVVLFHGFLEITWKKDGGGLPPVIFHIAQITNYGYLSVVVFIVISGYCLMLPVARSINGTLQGNILDYVRRRAKRILPPYYAALLLSLAILALTPLGHASGHRFDYALPAFRIDVLLSHFLLVHNWDGDWVRKINPPMWSIAVEWQIYFLFPLLLLPLWRRVGIISTVVVGCILGVLPVLLKIHRLDMSAPWFIGTFAMGMAGAAIGFSQRPFEKMLRERVPWGIVTTIMWLMVLSICIWKPELTGGFWKADFVVGIAATSLIIYCTQCVVQGKTKGAWPLRLLQHKYLVAIGSFSYSLYLIHSPLLGLATLTMSGTILSPAVKLMILFFIVTPLSIFIAFLFHCIFERPFMTGPHKNKVSQVQAL